METLKRNILALALLTGGSISIAAAQGVESQEFSSDSTRPIESILVIGTSPRSYRTQIRQLERELIVLYNANNDSRQMEIICRRVEAVHTMIRSTVCAPRYMNNNRSSGAGYTRRNQSFMLDELKRIESGKSRNDSFSQSILSLIAENGEFAAKVDTYFNLAMKRDFILPSVDIQVPAPSV